MDATKCEGRLAEKFEGTPDLDEKNAEGRITK